VEETQQKENGISILEPFKKLIWKFVISDTKSTTFIFALASLLFTLALVISSPVTNPFAFDSNWPFILCLLSIIIGRYYKTYITKVATLKSTVLTFTFVGVVIMIIHASFGVLDSFEVVSDYISGSILILIGLLTGVISSDLEDSEWLASALFMRHINRKLAGDGIQYLYYDTDGKPEIVNPNEVIVFFDIGDKIVKFDYKRKVKPYFHLTPITIKNNHIKSAYIQVMNLFEVLSPAWNDLMFNYKKSIQYGEIRASWIKTILMTLPKDPNSLTVGNIKLPQAPLSMNIDKEKYTISWGFAKMNWDETISKILINKTTSPILHTILDSTKPHNKILKIEMDLSEPKYDSQIKQNLQICANRTYYSLIIMLYDRISGNEGLVTDTSKQCIRNISKWYNNLQNNELFFSISNLPAYKFETSVSGFKNRDDWVDSFNNGIFDPSGTFLNIHDNLVTIANDASISKEIRALIQSSIEKATQEIINVNRKQPTTEITSNKVNMPSVTFTNTNTANKAYVIASALKLQFIYRLIENGKLKI
jgi:hypothetical protein